MKIELLNKISKINTKIKISSALYWLISFTIIDVICIITLRLELHVVVVFALVGASIVRWFVAGNKNDKSKNLRQDLFSEFLETYEDFKGLNEIEISSSRTAHFILEHGAIKGEFYFSNNQFSVKWLDNFRNLSHSEVFNIQSNSVKLLEDFNNFTILRMRQLHFTEKWD